jgi:hypothetical protein
MDDIYDFAAATRARGPLNALIHDYLAAKFACHIRTGCDDYYKLTNAISQRFLQPPFRALLYPTIQMRGNTDNVVLTPQYVDDALCFVNVEYLQIKRMADFSYDVEVIDSAAAHDTAGNLQWTGRPPNWVINENFGSLTLVARPDGHCGYVALNQRGERVDPV